MSDLTSQQLAALSSSNRITLVQAGPGSGKTRLFVEWVQSSLKSWTDTKYGIAALSFTNVAQQEIADRLGGILPAPHFIGTLDSFMLRFVVRPFAHLMGCTKKGVQLIPSPLDSQLKGPEVKIGLNQKDRVPICQVRFNRGAGGSLFKFPELYSGGLREVPKEYESEVYTAKCHLWAYRGWITHSDSQFIAAQILKKYPEVAKIIAKRFPVILIDEVQDTSWFLGSALISLIGSPLVRGMAVGDPDQAIYEFGGANPNIFGVISSLNGAVSLPLNVSQRCSVKVCAIATALAESGQVVKPKESAITGSARILVHKMDEPIPDLELQKVLTSFFPSSVNTVVLARRNQTLRRLAGTELVQGYPGKYRVAKAVDRAVRHLLEKNAERAYRIVSLRMSELVFGHEITSQKGLAEQGVALRVWKRSIYRILSTAAKSQASSWNAWVTELRSQMEHELEILAGKKISLAASLKKEAKDSIRSTSETATSVQKWPANFVFMNVHQAKGREFRNVVLFHPKPHSTQNPCPSTEWFAPGSEERRVAYVAVSRSQDSLVLCIHEKSFDSLKDLQPNFVSLFNVQFLGEATKN